MLEIGTLDRVTTVIGEKGTGKSTFLKHDIRAFQSETGGYAIVHSPNGQIGADKDIAFSRDAKELERNLNREPGHIHVVTQGNPEDLFPFVQSLSLALRKKAHSDAGVSFRPDLPPPKKIDAIPVLYAIDEGTHLKKESKFDDSTQYLEKMLTSARHHHVAYTLLNQAPTSRAWVFMEQASRMRIFRYVHQYGGTALTAAGIPADVVQKIKTLPRFVYYSYDKSGNHKNEFKYLEGP